MKRSAQFRAHFQCALVVVGMSLTFCCGLAAQDEEDKRPWEKTEVWDPKPPVVEPAEYVETLPPKDATILFGGESLKEWVNTKDGAEAAWKVADGMITVDKSVGNIQTRKEFRDYRLHLEFRIPSDISGSGQGRGNSGLFLASLGGGDGGYELQILDSFQNETYVNGMAGSIYKQGIPLANPARKPGEWQTYDVVWKAPRFGEDGQLLQPAFVTVLFNGIVVQNNFALKGQTVFIGEPSYRPYERAPIKLQSHGDPSEPISFRNIWVRELNEQAE